MASTTFPTTAPTTIEGLGEISIILNFGKPIVNPVNTVFVLKSLKRKLHKIIESLQGKCPTSYILVNSAHTSTSDAVPHFSVDAYNNNEIPEPIAMIHVYLDGGVTTFGNPRVKAMEEYEQRKLAAAIKST